MMKFNWGTGIFIFLVFFLIACAAFIIFALRQDVNLVHKDYYEKGVDYTEQMNVNARSKPLLDEVQVFINENFLQVNFEESLATKIDSGKVLFYRPSSSKMDISYPMAIKDNSLIIPKENLILGRYILKISWYAEGLKYEIDKPIDIQ